MSFLLPSTQLSPPPQFSSPPPLSAIALTSGATESKIMAINHTSGSEPISLHSDNDAQAVLASLPPRETDLDIDTCQAREETMTEPQATPAKKVFYELDRDS